MRSIYLPILFLFCTLSTIAQNRALRFDGTEEYLTVNHNNAYNIGEGFTIEAWIFAEAWTPAIWQGSIVAKDNQGPDRGFAFRCGDNGSLSFVMSVDNTWEEAFTGPIMNTNQWHHVATVVDDGEIRLYVDGVEMASHSFTGNPSHGADLDLHIGSSAGFGGRFFDGVLDEIRVWDVARTANEIADNTTTDFTGSEPGLVAYYPMNEGMGTQTGDVSATGNTAQFNQMDETNWVDGYALPDFDVSVQRVYGVDVVNMIDRPVKLRVNLQNTGTQPISDITVDLTLDGDLYTTEVVSSTIQPGEVLEYEFDVPVDLIGLEDPALEVSASHPNDGNSLNNEGTLNISTGTSSQVIVADKGFHNVGQLLNTFQMTLPNDLHRYEQMLLNIDLTCPSGGCGIWDVLADLKAVTSSGTYELARYVTPYGIPCGGWVVDITDFKSVLGGEVEFQSNIFVYTQEGWLLDLSIDLIDDNASDTHTKLNRLWERGYHVYGDPGIDDDLDPISISYDGNTETSHVRMTISGHGQGNTNNAAEFFEVDHKLMVDGSEFHNHHLWKNDCAANPCDDQNGTWLFNRAGWCPGQEVIPYIIDMDGVTNAGTTIDVDYELQDYTNLLNTGYNNNGHTEPYYRIHSFLIESSSNPYRDYQNLAADQVEAVISGNTLESATIDITNNGFDDLSGFTVRIYYRSPNASNIVTETFNDMIAVGETISKTIDVGQTIGSSSDQVLFAEVVNSDDDNPGDNVVKESILVDTEEPIQEYAFNAAPNPSSTGQFFLQYDEFWNGSRVDIFTSTGAIVKSYILSETQETIQLPEAGMFWYSVTKRDQSAQTFGKLLYIR